MAIGTLRSSMRKTYLFSPLLHFLVATFSGVSSLNERPVIGIVTDQICGTNRSYIAASYVKFLESAGARVMPILANSTEEELTTIFNAINGVLFPGGGLYLNTSNYGQVGNFLYQMAKKANDGGDYFPLWGTCLGFELLGYLEAGQDYSVLTSLDAHNLSLPLKFTQDVKTSKMLSDFSDKQLQWLSNENITFHNHGRGITLHVFENRPELNQFYRAIATSKDRNGTEFLSVMEAKDYPFYGVQWHPEKSAFEWDETEDICHSEHAIIIMQMAANFFVGEARRSGHSYSAAKRSKGKGLDLIYAYPITYTGDFTIFEQKYYF